MTAARFYVDPSVIVGLILDDFDLALVLHLIVEPATLVSSDFGLGEVIAGVSARARAARVADELFGKMIAAARDFVALWRAELIDPVDIYATDLVGRPDLALKFPDAIHLAIAGRLGLPLLTNDRQQHRAARTASIASRLLLQE